MLRISQFLYDCHNLNFVHVGFVSRFRFPVTISNTQTQSISKLRTGQRWVEEGLACSLYIVNLSKTNRYAYIASVRRKLQVSKYYFRYIFSVKCFQMCFYCSFIVCRFRVRSLLLFCSHLVLSSFCYFPWHLFVFLLEMSNKRTSWILSPPPPHSPFCSLYYHFFIVSILSFDLGMWRYHDELGTWNFDRR